LELGHGRSLGARLGRRRHWPPTLPGYTPRR
jgi:hypothetical protein